ncbi:MAG: hypothetical protein WC480_00775 [Patescibacteria group bacterium]
MGQCPLTTLAAQKKIDLPGERQLEWIYNPALNEVSFRLDRAGKIVWLISLHPLPGGRYEETSVDMLGKLIGRRWQMADVNLEYQLVQAIIEANALLDDQFPLVQPGIYQAVKDWLGTILEVGGMVNLVLWLKKVGPKSDAGRLFIYRANNHQPPILTGRINNADGLARLMAKTRADEQPNICRRLLELIPEEIRENASSLRLAAEIASKREDFRVYMLTVFNKLIDLAK